MNLLKTLMDIMSNLNLIFYVINSCSSVKISKDSRELKIKVLFDNGSQRSFISNRVADFLNLPSESVENICISTFGNNQSSSQNANVVTVQLKTKFDENIDLKVLKGLIQVDFSRTTPDKFFSE